MAGWNTENKGLSGVWEESSYIQLASAFCNLGSMSTSVTYSTESEKVAEGYASRLQQYSGSGWLHFLDQTVVETKDWDQTLIWPLNFGFSPDRRLAQRGRWLNGTVTKNSTQI